MNAAAVARIAADLETEASDSAKRIARDLFGSVPYGSERLTEAKFLDMVRRNWADANYRAALAVRIGDEAFLDAARAAGVIGDYKPDLATLEAQGALDGTL